MLPRLIALGLGAAIATGCQEEPVRPVGDAGAAPANIDGGLVAPAGTRLSHGPFAGSIRSDGAMVWARGEGEATLVVEIEGAPERKTAPLEAARDFTARVALEGLKPDTAYAYKVWIGESDAPPPNDVRAGRFRTPPAADAAKAMRLSFGGDLGGQNFCRDKTAGYAIFTSIAKGDPALFIGLGDMIYADGECSPVGRYSNWQWPARFGPSRAIEDFWTHYRYNFGDVEVAKVLTQRVYEPVWDDHEILNDAGPHNDTSAEPPYQAGEHLLPTARRAWLDYAPTSAKHEDPTYRAVRWGKHVELFFLDLRSYRDDRNAKDTEDKPKSMLGAAQRKWFEEAWTKSDATWRIIVSSVPISIPTGTDPKGPRDGWASMPGETGYERELTGIFEMMAKAGEKKSLWLTTDVHFASGFTYRPSAEKKDFEVVEIVVGPLAAGIFPKKEFDDTFHPERLFFHGPATAEAVAGYDDALQWLTYGEIDVDEKGALEVRVKNAKDALVWSTKLAR